MKKKIGVLAIMICGVAMLTACDGQKTVSSSNEIFSKDTGLGGIVMEEILVEDVLVEEILVEEIQVEGIKIQ